MFLYFKSMPDITPFYPPGTVVSIKMMLFDPEMGLSIKRENAAGKKGRGREMNECYSKIKKKNWG
jgi:hypothetical protein